MKCRRNEWMQVSLLNRSDKKNNNLCIRFRDPTYCICKEMSAKEKMKRADEKRDLDTCCLGPGLRSFICFSQDKRDMR